MKKWIVLAVTGLMVAGCGDDEPEPQQQPPEECQEVVINYECKSETMWSRFAFVRSSLPFLLAVALHRLRKLAVLYRRLRHLRRVAETY